jgi:hypothetical protein
MQVIRNQSILVLTLTLGAWLFAGTAGAEDCSGNGSDGSAYEGRVFEGEVKANKKNAKVTVDLKTKKKEKMREITIRQGGDPVPFAFHPGATVSGLKDDPNKIKKGDWLKICGPTSALATPRWAYAIEVVPKEESAVEVD